MNNKRVYKIAVWSFIVLGVIIFCFVSNDRLRRRWYAFSINKGRERSYSLKESKNNGTFLWEYEIPQKEIYYKDSIRTIHFAIMEAFVEKGFNYMEYAPEYIEIYEEARPSFILYYKVYDLHDPESTYKISSKEREFGDNSYRKMIYDYYNCTMPELLPDTIQIYLISGYPYGGELLPDDGDTLTVINLYKKYEQ